jgi:hypothetical protein
VQETKVPNPAIAILQATGLQLYNPDLVNLDRALHGELNYILEEA